MEKIDLGNHPVRNISVFTIGTIVSALGTVLATNSALGVTPSAALPYVISLWSGVSLGVVTFLVQMFFFVHSFVIMGKKNYRLVFLLTLPTLIIYSLFCDIFMQFDVIKVNNIGEEWIIIIIATAVHAIGISLQLASNLSMVPLDMFANHVSVRYGLDYGKVKVGIDIAMVFIAVAVSFAAFQTTKGVGWGTAFAAVTVGLIVSVLTRLYVRCGFYDWVGHLEYDYKNDENI